MITLDHLKIICPKAVPFWPGFETCFDRFQINTELRQKHFLTQACFETLGFTALVENLNYSKPERVAEIFKKYFDKNKDKAISAEELAFAATFTKNPTKLGNYVYANRMGNGPESSGDGYAMRGAGAGHLTGRDNITAYSKAMYGDDRVVRDPTMLQRSPDAVLSFGHFWFVNKINVWADKNDLKAVSGCVNAGNPKITAHGLDDGDRSDLDSRADWLDRIEKVLAGKPVPILK